MSRPQPIQKGNETSVHIIDGVIRQISALGSDTYGGWNKLTEPKTGSTLEWEIREGYPAPPPIVSKTQVLPTKPDDFTDILTEMGALLDKGDITIGSFASGIPIVFPDFENYKPDAVATVAYWLSDQEVGETGPFGHTTISGLVQGFHDTFRNANPYIRKVAVALCDAIVSMQQSGHWIDTTMPLPKQTAHNESWRVQFALPWRIKKAEHYLSPDGSQMFNATAEPIMPLIGFHALSALGVDPFVTPLSMLARTMPFEFSLDEPRWHDLFTEVEDDSYTDLCLLQLLDTTSGRWEVFEKKEGDLQLGTFVWDEVPGSIFSVFGRLNEFEFDAIHPHDNRWHITDEDFLGSGFSPNFRERIAKSKRYGKSYTFFSPCLALGSVGNVYASSELLFADMLTEYAEQVQMSNPMEADEEWGESSRFIPSFKDKRKIKTIDQAKGAVVYWSDIIRCRTCNGKVKVLLRERPVTVIFDCPHCGESGCIDCTHLHPEADWPEERKRKKVDLK